MSKGITMMAIAVAVAAGTYFTLEFMYPSQKGTVTAGHDTQAADLSFAADAERPVAATPAAPAEVTEPLPEPTDSTAESDAEADAFNEPAVAESTAADEVVEDPITAMDETDARSEPVRAAAPAPSPTPAPAVAAAPKPAPAIAAKPAAKPAPKAPAIAGGTSAPRLGGNSSAPPPTWWGQSAPGELGLVYAGSAAYERAIVLMFDGDFSSAANAGKRIRVSNAAGKTVSGSWSISENNPRMLLFKVDNPGTYTVSLNSELSDRGGRKLGRNQQGPVTVQ